MARAIRMGSNFHCGSTGDLTDPQDCSTTGDTSFAFEPFGNTPSDPPTVYSFNSTTHRIEKKVGAGNTLPITAPEVTIEEMRFYVIGTARGCNVNPCDTVQPKVVIVIKGTAPVANSKVRTSFHVQVTAVQRLLDL
jgi:hypothetical protein